jgi:hypothetical protein
MSFDMAPIAGVKERSLLGVGQMRSMPSALDHTPAPLLSRAKAGSSHGEREEWPG